MKPVPTPSSPPDRRLHDAVCLYELALDVGTTLDLAGNCARFLASLVAWTDLAWCGVYVKTHRLAGVDAAPSNGYRQVACHPLVRQPATWPAGAADTITPGIVQPIDWPAWPPTAEDGADARGTVFAFACGDMLLIMAASPPDGALGESFHRLLTHFAHSVDACLDHDRRLRTGRAERLEAIGAMARGIAHDLNNVLGPLLVYPDLIRHALPTDSPVVQDLHRMQAVALSAAEVGRDLGAISRCGVAPRQPVSPADAVRRTLAAPGNSTLEPADTDAEVETELDHDVMVLASLGPLERLSRHLIANALGAGRCRHVTVTVKATQVASTRGHYEPIPPGDYAVLSVTDDGPPIADAVQGRVFEPFVAVRHAGRGGNGLGLAVVFGIAKHLGGYVDIATCPESTRFSVYLPRYRAAPSPRGPGAIRRAAAGPLVAGTSE